LETYKQRGTVISYYVPDDYVLSQIRQKCQEEDRSVSQWSYRIIRRALNNDSENNVAKNELSGAHGDQPSAAPETTNPNTSNSRTRGVSIGGYSTDG
jgi:hypothetical protein